MTEINYVKDEGIISDIEAGCQDLVATIKLDNGKEKSISIPLTRTPILSIDGLKFNKNGIVIDRAINNKELKLYKSVMLNQRIRHETDGKFADYEGGATFGYVPRHTLTFLTLENQTYEWINN